MKTSSLLVFIMAIFLSSCSSLGSWYSLSPNPIDYLDTEKLLSEGFLVERIAYNNISYDLILFDPIIFPINIKQSTNERGLSFLELSKDLESDNKKILFATNGGIFKKNRESLGYLSIDGILFGNLNLYDGYGNFYLKPNGVFYMDSDDINIIETSKFAHIEYFLNSPPLVAIQSGPLLLENKNINANFTKGSINRFVRNAIGVFVHNENKYICLAISNKKVNFYDFTIFFKDFLNCNDALYLDGHISAAHSPPLKRFQWGGTFGSIIYILEP